MFHLLWFANRPTFWFNVWIWCPGKRTGTGNRMVTHAALLWSLAFFRSRWRSERIKLLFRHKPLWHQPGEPVNSLARPFLGQHFPREPWTRRSKKHSPWGRQSSRRRWPWHHQTTAQASTIQTAARNRPPEFFWQRDRYRQSLVLLWQFLVLCWKLGHLPWGWIWIPVEPAT